MPDYKPGLYFVREVYADHRPGRVLIWAHDGEVFDEMESDNRGVPAHGGDVLSGPHTAEDLLLYAQTYENEVPRPDPYRVAESL